MPKMQYESFDVNFYGNRRQNQELDYYDNYDAEKELTFHETLIED